MNSVDFFFLGVAAGMVTSGFCFMLTLMSDRFNKRRGS